MTKYIFKPYNPRFPHLFAIEKSRITAQGSEQLIVEHVGSTAVPGLGGKGIIDIAIAVPKNRMAIVAKELELLGYLFREQWSTHERLFFRIDLPDAQEGIQRYHVHCTAADSQEWKSLIFFRDYLRTHPEVAREYATIKQWAVQESAGDGEKYRLLKKALIVAILKQQHRTR